MFDMIIFIVKRSFFSSRSYNKKIITLKLFCIFGICVSQHFLVKTFTPNLVTLVTFAKYRVIRTTYLPITKEKLEFSSYNAGINLTGYHLPYGHPGAFAPECVPSSGAFAQQKMPEGRANK